MKKSIIVEYWRTLRQEKARALATIERANADLKEIEEKMRELNEFVGIDKEEKKLEGQEIAKEQEREDEEADEDDGIDYPADEEDTHPQMGER